MTSEGFQDVGLSQILQNKDLAEGWEGGTGVE